MAQNGVADKAMEVFLKGIYTRDNYVYFKLDITNNSELPYTYNYCGFAVITKKKGKMTSFDRTDLTPAGSYVPAHTIEYKKTMTVVYKFDKFNFSNDRVLLIEGRRQRGTGIVFRDDIIDAPESSENLNYQGPDSPALVVTFIESFLVRNIIPGLQYQ